MLFPGEDGGEPLQHLPGPEVPRQELVRGTEEERETQTWLQNPHRAEGHLLLATAVGRHRGVKGVTGVHLKWPNVVHYIGNRVPFGTYIYRSGTSLKVLVERQTEGYFKTIRRLTSGLRRLYIYFRFIVFVFH